MRRAEKLLLDVIKILLFLIVELDESAQEVLARVLASLLFKALQRSRKSFKTTEFFRVQIAIQKLFGKSSFVVVLSAHASLRATGFCVPGNEEFSDCTRRFAQSEMTRFCSFLNSLRFCLKNQLLIHFVHSGELLIFIASTRAAFYVRENPRMKLFGETSKTRRA